VPCLYSLTIARSHVSRRSDINKSWGFVFKSLHPANLIPQWLAVPTAKPKSHTQGLKVFAG
jgi:hypothetical protein